ncbi:hypothetical protein AAHE18_14G134600 [Arachis hypogaea]
MSKFPQAKCHKSVLQDQKSTFVEALNFNYGKPYDQMTRTAKETRSINFEKENQALSLYLIEKSCCQVQKRIPATQKASKVTWFHQEQPNLLRHLHDLLLQYQHQRQHVLKRNPIFAGKTLPF